MGVLVKVAEMTTPSSAQQVRVIPHPMLELGTKTYAAKKMLGNLTNVPTDMLQDMAFAILQAGRLLTSDEISELEQIEGELQHRSLCFYDQD